MMILLVIAVLALAAVLGGLYALHVADQRESRRVDRLRLLERR
jgi:hypothetical protein